jgi:flagellar hook-length control protein FliK
MFQNVLLEPQKLPIENVEIKSDSITTEDGKSFADLMDGQKEDKFVIIDENQSVMPPQNIKGSTLQDKTITSATVAKSFVAEQVTQPATTINDNVGLQNQAILTQGMGTVALPITMLAGLKKEPINLSKLEVANAVSAEKLGSFSEISKLDSIDLEITSDEKRVIDVKRFEKAFTQRIQVMVQQGRQIAEIRLDPPQMGKIDIAMQMQSNEITVLIAVENQQIKDLVEKSLAMLQQALGQNDDTQVNVNVSSRGDGNAQNNEKTNNGEAREGDEAIENEKRTVIIDQLLDVYS